MLHSQSAGIIKRINRETQIHRPAVSTLGGLGNMRFPYVSSAVGVPGRAGQNGGPCAEPDVNSRRIAQNKFIPGFGYNNGFLRAFAL